MNYIKNCSNCGGIQTYTTKGRLELSIRENWVCNDCSSVHAKKIYSDDVDEILLYIIKITLLIKNYKFLIETVKNNRIKFFCNL